jgi:hypothetical protein
LLPVLPEATMTALRILMYFVLLTALAARQTLIRSSRIAS